jgi:dihydrofolate reductase
MRKIIVLSFISLDGVMQAPGGPEEDTSGGFKYGGWTVPYFDEYSGKVMEEQMSKPADLLLGRKTFEIFASYWPHHESDWPGINDHKKFVVSKTLTKHEWKNSVFLKNVQDLKKLKNQKGPDLHIYGSSNLIQTLLKNNLIDELWLKIFPIALGKGKKLFGDGTIPSAYQLIKTSTSPSGIIFANYKRAGKVKTGSFGD